MSISRKQRRYLQSASLQQRASLPVIFINVYNLSPRFNRVFKFLGIQILHTGLEIYGNEYCFVGHPQSFSGILSSEPRIAPFPSCQFSYTIPLGHTDLEPTEVLQLIASLSNDFVGCSYNVISRNCNHFTNHLAQILTGSSIPGRINRLARCVSYFGGCFDISRFSANSLIESRSSSRPCSSCDTEQEKDKESVGLDSIDVQL
ncbi:hypothetical protein GEMRC1_004349 [Eukaryota sp. GEM-RC1]